MIPFGVAFLGIAVTANFLVEFTNFLKVELICAVALLVFELMIFVLKLFVATR
jgi:hypothetical protein